MLHLNQQCKKIFLKKDSALNNASLITGTFADLSSANSLDLINQDSAPYFFDSLAISKESVEITTLSNILLSNACVIVYAKSGLSINFLNFFEHL